VARRLMRGHKPQLDAQLAEEGEAFKRAVRGPEAREAFAAFFEKRKPCLRGLPGASWPASPRPIVPVNFEAFSQLRAPDPIP